MLSSKRNDVSVQPTAEPDIFEYYRDFLAVVCEYQHGTEDQSEESSIATSPRSIELENQSDEEEIQLEIFLFENDSVNNTNVLNKTDETEVVGKVVVADSE